MAIITIISVFPITTNVTTGLTSIDPGLDDLMTLYGASNWQKLWKLRLPTALPYLISGARVSSGLTIVGAIVGEFVSAQEGLGLLIQRFSFQLNTSAAYAVLLTLTVIGLVLYGLMELAARWIVYWNRDDRLHHRTEHAASTHAAALIRISKNQ